MIKRILILLTFFGFYSVPAMAQFKAGVIAGATFAQVDGDRISGYNKTGFTGGIYIDYPVSDPWDIGFEILYTMKGSKQVPDPDVPSSVLFRLRYDYIEFPVKLSYNKNDFTVYLGPTIGVNVVAKRDELGLGYMDTDIRPMEFGGIIGGHYNVSEKLGFGLRHQNSLVRIGDAYPNGLNIWNRAGIYNRLFAVYAVVHLGG